MTGINLRTLEIRKYNVGIITRMLMLFRIQKKGSSIVVKTQYYDDGFRMPYKKVILIKVLDYGLFFTFIPIDKSKGD